MTDTPKPSLGDAIAAEFDAYDKDTRLWLRGVRSYLECIVAERNKAQVQVGELSCALEGERDVARAELAALRAGAEAEDEQNTHEINKLRAELAEARDEIEGLKDQLAQQSIDLGNAIARANEAEDALRALAALDDGGQR